MPNHDMTNIDTDEEIAKFLSETNHLHDSCLTSLEFRDGRYVDENGAMNIFLGDQATLTLRFDQQSTPPSHYILTFEGVSRFDYEHDSTYDGIIMSCKISLHGDKVHFMCNEYEPDPIPLVHAKKLKFCRLDRPGKHTITKAAD